MKDKVNLTVGQLFYLAKILKADYIDYYYISAMGIVFDEFTKYESFICSELINKGYISEDFAGNIEVDQDVIEILKPVFFGDRESSIDVTNIADEDSVLMYKFHIGEKVVKAVNVNNEFEFSIEEELQNIIAICNSVIPQDYSLEATECVDSFDASKITQVIAVKNIKMGQDAEVKTYFKMNNVFYQESTENVISSLSREEIIDGILSIIMGVI